MNKDTVVDLRKPGEGVEDPLTEMLRNGARRLIAEAVEAELEGFLEEYRSLRDEHGRQRIVRNGYLPAREIQTGIGSIPVRGRRAHDRGTGSDGDKIRFHSNLLPRYLRRTKTMEALIPWLYLKGVSTGDFSDALKALVGAEPKGLTPNTISRLKQSWQQDFESWKKRDFSKKRYVYFWADGIYFNVRMDKESLCLLVIIGATPDGRKEFVAIEDGYREDAQSWREVLLRLKKQGLSQAPDLAIGDGALGFWKALKEVFGKTRWQRCWVHKTANVLSKLPKSIQKKAKSDLQEIWMAETKKEAEKAFDVFVETFELKYPKAVECLKKDRDAMLTFYDFPAEHWKNIRTTNPIESTFATVTNRTYKTKGCLSRETALAMVFQLILQAEKNWQRLPGRHRLADIIEGVTFVNGIRETRKAA